MNCVKVSTKKALAFIGTAQIGRQRPGYVLWAALVSSFVWLAPQVSLAQQGTVTDDATVTIKTSATHGTDMTLRLEADSSDASNVFVKFNLTSSLPPGSTATDISRATLKLFVGKLHTAGSFDVFRVLSPWSEQDQTVNPTINGSADAAGIPVAAENQFVVVDVTQLVKDWLNGVLSNNGIVLVPSTGSSVDAEFDSKEDQTTSHEPRLEMVMAKGGSGTVTSVTANDPLTVTNPTDTPNISLTGVVPSTNGGTGLSSTGAAGNFLKSNGSLWTSAPLSASDIPPGSGNYIQNATSQQPSSNFNISGNGKANVFDAVTQFNLGGNRVLTNAGFQNLFAGVGAGQSNTSGFRNSFFGFGAGLNNTTGLLNSFFGNSAGQNNTTGSGNSFFGIGAGLNNTMASENSFFGRAAGFNNTTGDANSFFGDDAGANNTTGRENSFFGQAAGQSNTTGTNNSFFGMNSGNTNDGDNNSFFGQGAGFLTSSGLDNSFFGQSAGLFNDTGAGNSFFGRLAGLNNKTGGDNTLVGSFTNVGTDGLTFATAIGSGAIVNASNTVVLGRNADTVQVPGTLKVSGGNIVVGAPGQGIILKSPDGATCRLVSIDNTGNMVLIAVACP
jgi:hypothetical protein